ncbi:MAG: FtsK/SpoIIIE domain-containing protein [Planctomycetota bacterium]
METPPFSTRRQLELMRALQRAATARHEEEERIARHAAEQRAAADKLRDERRRDAESGYERLREEAETQHHARRGAVVDGYERRRRSAQGDYRQARTEAQTHAAKTAEEADQERREAAWQILTIFDANKNEPGREYDTVRERLGKRKREIDTLTADVAEVAKSRGADATPLAQKTASAPVEATEVDEAVKRLDERVGAYRQASEAMVDDTLTWWAGGPGATLAFVVDAAAGGLLVGWLSQTVWIGAVAGVVLGGASAAVVAAWLVPESRRRTQEALGRLRAARSEALAALAHADRLAKQHAKDHAERLRTTRDRELGELGFRLDQLVGEAAAQSADQIEEASKLFPAMLGQMRDEHETQVAQIDTEHDARVAMLTQKREAAVVAADTEHAAACETIEAERAEAWQRMFERWLRDYDDIRAELRDMRAEAARLFPDFAATDYADWPKPGEAAPAIAFGSTEIDLAKIKHGLSEDDRLTPPETRLGAPLLMSLAEHPTMLITAEGEARARGVELMRLAMLRFLTAMPPGKVRFTIFDPVGLGDNFQSFMHLADADEQLIAHRIWSESRDIEEQLARLTSHLETVLQKYLRSEYETIHEYNAMAGEVAEPFQVLVAAGFPTNYSESAARRLVSLVTGGPRCGVYTLIGVDTARRLPTDFALDELKANAVWLDASAADTRGDSPFVWRYPAFESLPLRLDAEPPAERMIDTLKKAGAAAKAAVKVEVPFSVVAPPEGQYWDKTCGDELRVPVGRAGANRVQDVRLGKGTSQHLLVAGKTGSGKSTFLHALVTSGALHYSPDELEFYLVDFKKGVEFKSYATHRMPHARVIAIESEREFGLSVLERLDEELKRRGERFRAEGVQNLADYRANRPDESTPRILLIIDEFQELFVEDDKLAAESSLLMDRLVRQGRAFGMHVVLGTQTLAGAYSLARSTLGQVAVRVALECSEADAHLILSDERNTAARFLSRPGEAIYNAQNGLITANEPFQVVWLPDNERRLWLDALDERRHRLELPAPEQVVFEGNAPADPLTNRPLAAVLDGETAPAVAGTRRAWLGAAVAIKPPAAAEFARRPGANLIAVGAQEADIIGVTTTTAVSLVAADEGARLVVLDASRGGEAGHGVWPDVAAALGQPQAVRVEADDAGALSTTLTELTDELKRRESAGQTDAPPVYLVLHNAGRFRDLRRTDDDYGFGGFGAETEAPPKLDKQLAELLTGGPAFGLHTLVWCDSYKSVTRLFDRQTLREFALRVALQLSAADSSNLIDSPAASDLRMHRALLYNDETGQIEKFRPYGPPTAAWLERVSVAKRGG